MDSDQNGQDIRQIVSRPTAYFAAASAEELFGRLMTQQIKSWYVKRCGY